jgi:GNAT superfamily N-acetyltransferase
MTRIGFRSTTVADESTLRSLLQEAHGVAPGHPMFEGRHLHWKYWEPREDWQGSRSYVLTRDGRIIAHAAIVPALCSWGTERLKVLHVIDWAARAEARGAGNTLMQHIGTLADAILTSEGGDAAWRLLPFLGFAESKTVVTQYARPLRPLLYLTGADVPRWRLAARCVRNALWALRAPAGAPGAQRSRHLAADEVAAAPMRWPAPRRGTAVLERSAAVMSYWLQCPAAPMELYVVENGSAAEGYFVLAFAPGQARLADCWLDSDDPGAWEGLVQLAVRQAARHTGVAELAVIGSEPLLATALERCGFHARASRPLMMRATNGVRLPPAEIRIQMLDDDTAYRHSGSRLFWA